MIRSWRWSPQEWRVSLSEKTQERWSLSASWGHSKRAAVYKLGRGLSLDTKSGSTLILDFLISRTMKKKCLLYKPCNVIICNNSQGWLRQVTFILLLSKCSCWTLPGFQARGKGRLKRTSLSFSLNSVILFVSI